MATHDLAVRGGTVVTGRGRALLDVLVDDGHITALVPPGHGEEATRTIDAAGTYVLPGFVDTHVHLMDPGDPTREDFPTGTEAALRQGVTTVIEHTHAWPVTDVERLREKLDHLQGRSWVDFGLAAHAWTGGLADVVPLWRAGVAFFKVFTCATHGVPATLADSMLDLFEVTASHDIPCLVHCEDDLVTARNERRLKAAGRVDPMLLAEWRSRDAEEVAVATVGVLAGSTGARVTIAHASRADVVDMVSSVRGRGASIVSETCPQYFFLREPELAEHGPLRKFTPPARARHDGDEDAMWAAFNSGAVHHISTDHAPATLAQKHEGDMWSCHFGLPGLDTTAALLLDAALVGRTSLERVVAAYAEAPAAFYGLRGKGRLAPGADADLVVFDPRATRRIDNAEVVSRAGWSPFAGRAVRGAPVATIVRGRVLCEEGKLTDDERTGRFVPGPGAEGSTR